MRREGEGEEREEGRDRPVGIPRKRAPRPKPGVTRPSRWSGKGGSGRDGPTRRGRFSREIGAMEWMGGAEVIISVGV